MRIFAIADLHLATDERVNKPMDMFGVGWENHVERVKAAWIERVAEDDIVLVPGDISWGLRLEEALPDIEWIHNLPGTKLISKGNHDLWWSKINYLNSLYEDIVFLQNDCYYIKEENVVICATRGWPYPGSDEYSDHDEKIYKRELQRLKLGLDAARSLAPNADLVVALHYPPSDISAKTTEFTAALEAYGAKLCVYGHLHGMAAFGAGIKGLHNGVQYKLVSLDYLGCIPKAIYDSNGGFL